MEGCNYLLNLALGCIRILGEIAQEFKEIGSLATEQPVGRKGLHRPLSNSFGIGWPNDRACREIPN